MLRNRDIEKDANNSVEEESYSKENLDDYTDPYDLDHA